MAFTIEAKPAFETIYEDQESMVEQYMKSKTGNHWIAQDLAGDALLKAYLAWDKFDVSRGLTKHWLMRIAHNEMVNHYRRDRKTISLEVVSWQVAKDDPAEEVERKMLSQRIRQAIISLGEPESTVIRGLYFEGKKNREIAQEIGKSYGAVRVIASRGRHRLKGILGDSILKDS